jgi:hypothetical protein
LLARTFIGPGDDKGRVPAIVLDPECFDITCDCRL